VLLDIRLQLLYESEINGEKSNIQVFAARKHLLSRWYHSLSRLRIVARLRVLIPLALSARLSAIATDLASPAILGEYKSCERMDDFNLPFDASVACGDSSTRWSRRLRLLPQTG
jgi:hypothetical protein